MKIAAIIKEEKEFTQVKSQILRLFTLDCFLHHKIKLIRNWGMADDTDQLPFNNTTLLQFTTPSANVQILIKPKEARIIILHMTKRGRKLYLYFVEKLSEYTKDHFEPF